MCMPFELSERHVEGHHNRIIAVTERIAEAIEMVDHSVREADKQLMPVIACGVQHDYCRTNWRVRLCGKSAECFLGSVRLCEDLRRKLLAAWILEVNRRTERSQRQRIVVRDLPHTHQCGM